MRLRARRRRRPPPCAAHPAPARARARAGSDAATSESLTDKILDTNPILEAFGNAKTTRNKNSSRFGRYVLVQFSADNEVVGAEIRTFLLERSRVTQTGKANERSYHVLYQVVKGSPHCPEGIDKYRYLAMSGCTEIDGVNRMFFRMGRGPRAQPSQGLRLVDHGFGSDCVRLQ